VPELCGFGFPRTEPFLLPQALLVIRASARKGGLVRERISSSRNEGARRRD